MHVFTPRRLVGALLVPLAFAPDHARAEGFNETRAQAMGGAVHADPVANSSLVSNPAGLARTYAYGAEVCYFRTGPGDRNGVGVNVVDSKTQPSMAVGLAYGYEFSDPKAKPKFEGHNARLAFAHPLIANQLSMGVGLHYLNYDRGGAGDNLSAFTMDAGLVFSATSAFHIGLAGQNLINTDDPEVPMLAGGGIAYTGEFATIDLDTMADFTTQKSAKPVFLGGLEFMLGDIVPVRAGVERNQATEQTKISGGIGFVAADERESGSQLNVSFTQSIDKKKDFQFGAGFVIFL